MSKRDAFVSKLKAQLDEWNADLDRLEAKMRGAEAGLKMKYEERIAALRRQRDEAKRRLSQIQEAAEDSWEHLKQGTEDAWAALKGAFARARDEFKG
jgi:DNA repair ATPase RecN